jgi:hypothetical protein
MLVSGCGESGAASDAPGTEAGGGPDGTVGDATTSASVTTTSTTMTATMTASVTSTVGGSGTTTGAADTGADTGEGGTTSLGSVGMSAAGTEVGGATASTGGGPTATSSISAGGANATSDALSSEGSTGGGAGGAESTATGAGGTGNVALHPDDAVEFGGHWYRFTQAAIGGAEAEAICEGLQGYLACVESEAEDDFLFTLAGTARPWIGLNNEVDVNTWVWVDGSPVTYTNWQPGQPDNPEAERWVKIAEDSMWDDGNIASSYICEWDS